MWGCPPFPAALARGTQARGTQACSYTSSASSKPPNPKSEAQFTQLPHFPHSSHIHESINQSLGIELVTSSPCTSISSFQKCRSWMRTLKSSAWPCLDQQPIFTGCCLITEVFCEICVTHNYRPIYHNSLVITWGTIFKPPWRLPPYTFKFPSISKMLWFSGPWNQWLKVGRDLELWCNCSEVTLWKDSMTNGLLYIFVQIIFSLGSENSLWSFLHIVQILSIKTETISSPSSVGVYDIFSIFHKPNGIKFYHFNSFG